MLHMAAGQLKPLQSAGGAKKGSSALFLLYIEALSVQTAKQALRAAEGKGRQALCFHRLRV